MILGQIRCDSSGNIAFRQTHGPYIDKGMVIEIEKGGSRSHVFELPGPAAPKLKTFSVVDFTVRDSNLLVLLQTADYKTHILRYSTADQSVASEIILDDSKAAPKSTDGYLNGSKIAIMPTGQLLIIGSRTLLIDKDSHKYKFSPAMELYSGDGRFINPVEFRNEKLNWNDPAHDQAANFRSLDLAISANGPDGVYFAMETKGLKVFCISPSSEVTKQFDIAVPEGYRSIDLQVLDGQLLVQYVANKNEEPVPDLFVSYSAETGEALTAYTTDTKFSGAFACFDGRGPSVSCPLTAWGSEL